MILTLEIPFLWSLKLSGFWVLRKCNCIWRRLWCGILSHLRSPPLYKVRIHSFLIFKNMLPASKRLPLSLCVNAFTRHGTVTLLGPRSRSMTRSRSALNFLADYSMFPKMVPLLKQRWRTSYLFLDYHCFLCTCLRQNYCWHTSHTDDKSSAFGQGDGGRGSAVVKCPRRLLGDCADIHRSSLQPSFVIPSQLGYHVKPQQSTSVVEGNTAELVSFMTVQEIITGCLLTTITPVFLRVHVYKCV